MKKYTQEDFNSFEIVGDFKICPTGDYLAIKKFPGSCEFSKGCKFKKSCSFEGSCKFGDDCKFGHFCKFGSLCEFGNDCQIGSNCDFCDFCKFGNGCKFDLGCRLGIRCKFGDGCKFSLGCTFGELCKVGENSSYEDGAVVNGKFIRFGNIGVKNREAYLYIDENKKLFLRAGCFFGDLEAFKKHCKVEEVANKTIKQYLFLFKISEEYFEIND